MTGSPSPRPASLARQPELRLIAGERPRHKRDGGARRGEDRAGRRAPSHQAPAPPMTRGRAAAVLLAGGDAGRRSALRRELGAGLSQGARFAEAGDLASALERARFSRMVIVDGDLEDADAASLVHLLRRRHPELPVVRFEDREPIAVGACG